MAVHSKRGGHRHVQRRSVKQRATAGRGARPGEQCDSQPENQIVSVGWR